MIWFGPAGGSTDYIYIYWKVLDYARSEDRMPMSFGVGVKPSELVIQSGWKALARAVCGLVMGMLRVMRKREVPSFPHQFHVWRSWL